MDVSPLEDGPLPPFTSQTSEYNQTHAFPDVINLMIGQPSPSLLSLTLIRRSVSQWTSPSLDPLVLQYGAGEGFFSFRQSLARFLSNEYSMNVDPQELFVTCGNSQALDLTCRLFLKEGDLIGMEDPSYFLAKYIFQSSRCSVLPLSIDGDGMKVSDLEKYIEEGKVPKLVYTIPNYQNPTGVVLSEERKRHLVALAKKHNFVIFSDEPYNLLHFPHSSSSSSPQNPPTTLMKYDEGQGVVIAAGSFSKILAPGLRLGWIHANKSLLSTLLNHGIIRSGGGLNPFVAFSIKSLLDDGDLKKNIERLNDTFRLRRDVMCETLSQHLPQGVSFHLPSGGYFVWVVLPQSISSSDVLKISETKHKVKFAEGIRCSVTPSPSQTNCLRLSFAFYNEKEIEKGVRLLCLAIDEVLNGQNENK